MQVQSVRDVSWQQSVGDVSRQQVEHGGNYTAAPAVAVLRLVEADGLLPCTIGQNQCMCCAAC